MNRMLKKFWHWMRCEDENGEPLDKPIVGVTDLRYSECIKKFPLKEGMSLDDILKISHRRNSDGKWETCYITIKQLKEAIINL